MSRRDSIAIILAAFYFDSQPEITEIYATGIASM